MCRTLRKGLRSACGRAARPEGDHVGERRRSTSDAVRPPPARPGPVDRVRRGVGVPRRHRRDRGRRPRRRARRLRLRRGVRPHRRAQGAGPRADHGVVGLRGHPGVPGGRHASGPARRAGLRLGAAPPAGGGQAVGDARRTVRGSGHPGGRRRTPSTASSPRSASTPPGATPCWTRRSTQCGRRSTTSSRRTPATPGPTRRWASPPGPCRRTCPCGWAARPTSRCAAPRRGPTAGCRRGRPRAACPLGSPTCAACSTRRGGRTEPFTVGARSGALYVGEPRWDVGRAVHGSPEQVAGFLRVLAGLGVDQIEVAFRSRDVHELYDQIRLFGAEVAPLVR